MSDLLNQPVLDFLSATAAKTPTPGGGSVAALVGALSAALAEMSLQYTVNKKGFEQHRPAVTDAIARLEKARAMFTEFVAEDMAAYEAVSVHLKTPKEQREKDPEYLAAVAMAISVPEAVGALAMNVLEQCVALADKTNKMLISDLAMGGALANATVRGAELNVLVNLKMLPDAGEAAAIAQRARQLTARADDAWTRLRVAVDPLM